MVGQSRLCHTLLKQGCSMSSTVILVSFLVVFDLLRKCSCFSLNLGKPLICTIDIILCELKSSSWFSVSFPTRIRKDDLLKVDHSLLSLEARSTSLWGAKDSLVLSEISAVEWADILLIVTWLLTAGSGDLLRAHHFAVISFWSTLITLFLLAIIVSNVVNLIEHSQGLHMVVTKVVLVLSMTENLLQFLRWPTSIRFH